MVEPSPVRVTLNRRIQSNFHGVMQRLSLFRGLMQEAYMFKSLSPTLDKEYRRVLLYFLYGKGKELKELENQKSKVASNLDSLCLQMAKDKSDLYNLWGIRNGKSTGIQDQDSKTKN